MKSKTHRSRSATVATFALPATGAYRADCVDRESPFGPHDGAWIAITSLLQQAALLPPSDRTALLTTAYDQGHAIATEIDFEKLASREWGKTERSPSDVLVYVADQAFASGATRLAAAMLSALLEANASLSLIQQGRVVARQARMAWKSGAIDEAMHRCALLQQLGREAKSDELKCRAAIGFIVIAQFRGNYPEMRRHAATAARLAAKLDVPELTRHANHARFIGFAKARRVEDALLSGWNAYLACEGEPSLEGEMLQNIGQLMLEEGHTAEAKAAFASVVSMVLSPQIHLAALGGLALSAAAESQRSTVTWSLVQVQRFDVRATPRYALALAFFECSVALARVGENAKAEVSRQRALAIAREHDFYEIIYSAEQSDHSAKNTPPSALSDRAATVARKLRWMEPQRLPRRIAVASALEP